MTPDDPRHGTTNGYTNLGCRCADCRAANTAYCREQVWRRASIPTAELEHGRYSTYTNYSCRCDACKAANAAKQRRYNAKRKAAKR